MYNDSSFYHDDRGYRSHAYYQNDDSGKGMAFFWVVTIFFLVTALFRSMSLDEMGQRLQKQAVLFEHKDEVQKRYFAAKDRYLKEAVAKGSAYTYVDALQARNALFGMNDTLERCGVEISLVPELLVLAERNAIARGELPMLAMNDAQMVVGEPASITQARKDILTNLSGFVVGTLKHMLWFSCLMPFMLLGRLATSHRFQWKHIVEAITVYAWWLAVCSVCWPVLALKHAGTRPRETMRFWWLRLGYLFTAGKVFLTVAEKQSLLAAAGTPEQNLAQIFHSAESALQSATDTGRRLAFASFLTGLFTFGGINLQTVMAQSTQVVVTDSAKKPLAKHEVSGFVIASAEADGDHQNANLDYARLSYRYTNNGWLVWAQVDPTSALHLKWGMIGYDSPELQAGIWGGRIVSPYAWAFVPAFSTDFIRTALDGDLGVPFCDNGIYGHVSLKDFALRVAALNGSGDYSDNNRCMDGSARVTYMHGKVALGATIQRGMQPYGQFRELNGADFAVTISSITFRVMALERPDLKRKGISTSVVFRAGPLSYAVQGEYVEFPSSTKRYLDGGVNFALGDKVALLVHAIGESGQPPKLVAQFKRGF